jgi:hypothetical protein
LEGRLTRLFGRYSFFSRNPTHIKLLLKVYY